MHAVVVKVTVKDRAKGVANLRERVVPMVSGAPGFVAGYWLSAEGPSEEAISFVVFESEDQAQSMADQVHADPDSHVTIESVETRAVIANA